jgi:hypothetical protein
MSNQFFAVTSKTCLSLQGVKAMKSEGMLQVEDWGGFEPWHHHNTGAKPPSAETDHRLDLAHTLLSLSFSFYLSLSLSFSSYGTGV